jgi:uncharacterized protein YwqG
MTHDDITTACTNAGLAGRATQIIQAARTCVLLTPELVEPDALASGASRIGGLPDMPMGAAWPEWRDGPLAFIAQLKLEDLAGFPACAELPATGHLLFFYHAEQATWGFDPADRGSWHVIYVQSESLQRATSPAALAKHAIFRPCSVSYGEEITLPPPESAAFEALGFSENEREAYFDVYDGLLAEGYGSSTWVLGYPDQIQGDMQTECALVSGGLYTGDESGWTDPRAKQLEKDASSWRLLFQVGSEDAAGMMWGDAGCLYFWMHERDLAARAFDRAWMILQCS